MFVAVKFYTGSGIQNVDKVPRLRTNLEKVAVFEALGDTEVNCDSPSVIID